MAELTPEEIKREQERLDLLQRQNQAAKELAETYKKIEKSGVNLSTTDKEILDLTKQLSSFSSSIEKSIQKRLSESSTSKDLAKSIKDLEYDKLQNERKFGDISKTINANRAKALSEALSLHQQERSIQKTLTEELKAQDDILDSIQSIKNQSGPLDKDALNAARENLILNKKAISDLSKSLEKITKQKETQKDLVKQLNATKKAHEDIIKEQEEELVLTKEALKLKKQEEVVDAIKEKFRVKEIADMLTLSGIVKLIIDGALRYSKISADISHNLGYGAGKANLMAAEMTGMSLTSNNLNVNTKNLAEAMSDLNTATGGVAEYSDDALETQIMLTKQFGLTGEEAAGIYKFSALTGESSSEVNKQMASAFANTRNAVKGSANFKATIAEASKVSGQLAANLQNNPGAITAAVVKMQALGTSLAQTKDQGEKLLDFQSSIESELKAELLTGKELNLERARAAALAGDQVTLAEELNKNVGSLEDFQKMNVLQQKSLAEAVGLTADQLADQLRKQKVAQEQGKSLAQVTAEENLEAQKRQGIQDRFNALIEKLMDIIGAVGVLLTPIIWAFEKITNNAWLVYTVLGLWVARSLWLGKSFKGILGSIVDIGKNIGNKILGKTAAPAAPAPTAPTTPAAGGGAGGFMKGINTTDMIKGAAAILILSAALFVAAKAFQEFATVKWEDVAKGVVGIGALAGIAFLLSKASGDMITGSVALAILGVALIPFAYALSLLANVKMESVLAAAAGLVIFGAAVFGLGALMMTGVGAFIFGAGILAIIALGGAMLILGLGLQAVSNAGTGITALFKSLTELDVDKLTQIAPALLSIGEGIMALGAGSIMAGIGGLLGGGPVDIIKGIAESGDGIQKAATGLQAMASALQQVSAALSGIDVSKLLAIGPALTMIGIGLASLGAGGVIGAIGAFLGGDPIKKIEQLAEAGDGLQNAATGLQGIASALTQVSAALSSIDISKLEALSDFTTSSAIGGAVSGITSLITAPIKAVGSMVEGTGGSSNNTEMVKAINEVRDAVNKLYSKDQSIHMDGKKVGTTLTQNSYKVA